MDEHTMTKSNRGCRAGTILILIAGLLLILISTFVLFTSPSTGQQVQASLRTEQAEVLRAARAEALQPWDIVLSITLRVALVVALLGTVIIGLRWLDTRARLIRPDRETGQMPAYRARRGETVIDMNRSVDGKTQTAMLGGKTALFLSLAFRYLLDRDPPPELQQPAVTVLQPDTSPAQMQITSQDQVARVMLAASRGKQDPQSGAQVAQALAQQAHPPQGLPPLLIEGVAPRETQLLLETARREWDGDLDTDEHS